MGLASSQLVFRRISWNILYGIAAPFPPVPDQATNREQEHPCTVQPAMHTLRQCFGQGVTSL